MEGAQGSRGGKVKSGWVSNWRKLCNPSLRETTADVIRWLVERGYAAADGTPTEAALRRGLARRRQDGVVWNLTRYVSLRREERRAQRR